MCVCVSVYLCVCVHVCVCCMCVCCVRILCMCAVCVDIRPRVYVWWLSCAAPAPTCDLVHTSRFAGAMAARAAAQPIVGTLAEKAVEAAMYTGWSTKFAAARLHTVDATPGIAAAVRRADEVCAHGVCLCVCVCACACACACARAYFARLIRRPTPALTRLGARDRRRIRFGSRARS